MMVFVTPIIPEFSFPWRFGVEAQLDEGGGGKKPRRPFEPFVAVNRAVDYDSRSPPFARSTRKEHTVSWLVCRARVGGQE